MWPTRRSCQAVKNLLMTAALVWWRTGATWVLAAHYVGSLVGVIFETYFTYLELFVIDAICVWLRDVLRHAPRTLRHQRVRLVPPSEGGRRVGDPIAARCGPTVTMTRLARLHVIAPGRDAADDACMDLPFRLETDLERRIAADPSWRVGIEWGTPRPGHPEGAVKWHIVEVLANLDRLDLPVEERTRLRIAALVHDAFKHAVDRSIPHIPPNEHGHIASRRLAATLEDDRLLALIELHDEGFRAWRAHQAGREDEARQRIDTVVRRMGDAIGDFVSFYWADNRSGDKDPRQLDWFAAQLSERGIDAQVPFA